MDWIEVIDNTNLALTIFMAVLPLFKDVIDRSDANKPFYKKITVGGWLLVTAGIVMIILNVVKQNIDEKEKKKETASSEDRMTKKFESLLKSNNLVLDKSTGEIKKDTVTIIKIEDNPKQPKPASVVAEKPKMENPEILLSEAISPNPLIENGNLTIMLTCNYFPAYIESYKYYVFYERNGGIGTKPYILDGGYKNWLNPLQVNSNKGVAMFLNQIPGLDYSKLHIVFRVRYKNRVNVPMPDFMKVFEVPKQIQEGMRIPEASDANSQMLIDIVNKID